MDKTILQCLEKLNSFNEKQQSDKEVVEICELSESLLSEFWGGLRNVFQGAKAGAQPAGQAIGRSMGAIGRGVASAGAQFGQNVANAYNAGNQQANITKMIKTGRINLVNLMDIAKRLGLQPLGAVSGKGPGYITLAQLNKMLSGIAASMNQQVAPAPVTSGVGTAFRTGYAGA